MRPTVDLGHCSSQPPGVVAQRRTINRAPSGTPAGNALSIAAEAGSSVSPQTKSGAASGVVCCSTASSLLCSDFSMLPLPLDVPFDSAEPLLERDGLDRAPLHVQQGGDALS